MAKEFVSETSKRVGANMKRIIQESGNTQESASALFDISRPLLNLYLNGNINIPIDFIEKFSEKFGVPIEALMGKEKGAKIGGGLDSVKLLKVQNCVDAWLKRNKLWMTPEDKAKAISFLYAQNATSKETTELALSAWRLGNSESFRGR